MAGRDILICFEEALAGEVEKEIFNPAEAEDTNICFVFVFEKLEDC